MLSESYFMLAKKKSYNKTKMHSYLDSALNVEYFNIDAWMYKGAMLLLDRKFIEAQKFFNKLIVENPENVNAHLNLGISNFHLNRLENATSNFEDVIRMSQNRPIPYYYLGIISIKIGQKKEAIELLQKAFDLGFDKALELLNELSDS